jgi:hypothetical protein
MHDNSIRRRERTRNNVYDDKDDPEIKEDVSKVDAPRHLKRRYKKKIDDDVRDQLAESQMLSELSKPKIWRG